MVGQNREAVKIDDWVNDIRGSLVGWKDASDETPADFNDLAFKPIYVPHKDSNKSWIFKFVAPLAKVYYKLTDRAVYPFEVGNTAIPKSAIDGFPNGMTVNNINKELGTPDKRVILRNDCNGNRAYMDEVGPESDNVSKKRSKLKERINELEQALEAEHLLPHDKIQVHNEKNA